MVNTFPPSRESDQALFDRVRTYLKRAAPKEISLELARDVAGTEGYDFAVAMLYEQLRNSPAHASFIRTIDHAHEASSPADLQKDVLIGVVPGAFHRERPETGADGRRLIETVRHCGYEAELVPLPSLGTMRANAEQLEEWIDSRRERNVLLISLSKGSADVLSWLSNFDHARKHSKLVGWISLSGIIQGSVLFDWLRQHPVRMLVVRLLTCWKRYDFTALAELARREKVPDVPSSEFSQRLKMVHVVGFPKIENLSSDLARRVVRRTAEFGPNDGGGIVLADVLTWPGVVYPAWRADHYLRPMWDFRRLIARLLAWATTDEGGNLRKPSEYDSRPAQPLEGSIPATGEAGA